MAWLLNDRVFKITIIVLLVYFLAIGTETSKCSPGYYTTDEVQDNSDDQLIDSICVKCKKGTFSNIYGALECIPCKKGSFSQMDGSSYCTKCFPGFYQDSEGQSICKKCNGKFTTIEFGESECSKPILTQPSNKQKRITKQPPKKIPLVKPIIHKTNNDEITIKEDTTDISYLEIKSTFWMILIMIVICIIFLIIIVISCTTIAKPIKKYNNKKKVIPSEYYDF